MGEKRDLSGGEPRSESGVPGVDLTPHPIGTTILDESGEPRETALVVGFLGVADANDLVRIYLDLSFRTYLEMPAKKVLYVEKFDPSNELQPTKILVASDSPLKLVRTVEASLIEGSIVSAYPVTPPVATGNVEGVPGRFPQCEKGE